MALTKCSVIVPMFNEINNINSCIRTLENQTCKDFEVIFIDDGSTDGTIKRLTEMLANVSTFTFQIISQSNMGAAHARKIGIEKASTDIIMILDCDDTLSSDAIENGLASLEQYNADISMFNLIIIKQDGGESEFQLFSKKDIYTGMECLYNSLGGWKVHGFMLCKKSIYLNCYKAYYQYNQNNNYINNDEVLTRIAFLNAKTIVSNKGRYFYSLNMNSTTRRVNQNKYLMLNNAIILHDMYYMNKYLSLQADKELINTFRDIGGFFLKNIDLIIAKAAWKKNILRVAKEIFRRRVFKRSSFREKRKIIKLIFNILLTKV